MSNALSLLALPTKEAARQIVIEGLKPEVDPKNIEVGVHVVRADSTVSLPVYSSRAAYSNPDWPYRGAAEMVHRRLDLQESFGYLRLQFRVGARYTTDQLTAKIAAMLNMRFEQNDFFRETLNLSGHWARYILRASPESARWKGQVSILVHR